MKVLALNEPVCYNFIADVLALVLLNTRMGYLNGLIGVSKKVSNNKENNFEHCLVLLEIKDIQSVVGG